MNRIILKFPAMSILWLVATTSQAGWVGGGGMFIEDKMNPWFIQNTKTVSYCVEADEANFGVAEAQLEVFVGRAFALWKRQADDLLETNFGNSQGLGVTVRVAKQAFVGGACSDATDIKFQFGTLTAQQQTYLGDPTQLAAISVRTDYDRRMMRGKGFVYFSPQKGPLKLKKSELAEPWSYHDGELVEQLLVHELGHIFGINHIESHYLLSESVADKLLQMPEDRLRSYSEEFRGLQTGKSFLFSGVNPRDRVHGYSDAARLQEIWGLGESSHGVLYQIKDNVFRIFNESGSKLYGSARLIRKSFFQSEPVGNIWFPPEQQVFSNFQWKYPTFFARFPGQTHYDGLYRSADGRIERSIKITDHHAGGIDIGGEYKGKFYIDFMKDL